jgi:CTP synthase
MARIALIGDFNPGITAHRAIPRALAALRETLEVSASWDWLHSISLDSMAELEPFDALWCVPGSPYANTAGVIDAIRFARETQRPFLGTCGGFQHALLEYAQSVWGVASPAHAETDPLAADPVITPLDCALLDVADEIHFEAGTRLAAIYGVPWTLEEYRCRYGLSRAYAARLEHGDLRIAARDSRGDVVAVEHQRPPFFIATLFQPERGILTGKAMPLVSAFLAAAVKRADGSGEARP